MKAGVEPTEERKARLAAITQEGGAERRAEGQRVEGGKGDRDRDRQGELVVKAAGNARDEGDRNEDRKQDCGGRDDRACHFLHRLARSGKWRQAGLKLTFDVLDDDDRVVDHEADGEHHAEQAQHVQRKAEQIHDDQRRDQRHRDGDRRNDRSAQVLQEDEDDEDDEGERLEQRKHHILHRRRDEAGGVVKHVVGDACGEALRQFIHFGLDAALQVERIGTRRLEYGEYDTFLAVEGDRRRIEQCPEFDARHIAQPRRRPGRLVGPKHDIAELRRIAQPTERVDLHLEGCPGWCRRLPDLAACDLDVLFAMTFCTSTAVMPRLARRSGSSQTRIE